MKIQTGLPRLAIEGEFVALDVEVYGQEQGRLHRPTGTFACLSVHYPRTKETWVIEDVHDLWDVMNRVEDGMWVMHNALYDIAQLRRWVGIDQRLVWDTMLIEQDLYGGYYDAFSLPALTRRYLHRRMKKEIRDLFPIHTTMTASMRQYAATDAVRTGQIAMKQIGGEDLRCYWEIDEPAIWAVLDMLPVKVDVEGWLRMARGFRANTTAIENRLGFNPRSPNQVKEAIYKATGKRVKNTNAKDTLIPLLRELEDAEAEGADVVKAILDCRMYGKAASTWGDKWIEKYVEEDDLVYSGWRITGADKTGRMSSRDPNLQNIPSKRLPQYRERFISQWPRGRLLVSDIAQQEPRILAHFSQDEELLQAFKMGVNVHQVVADAIGCGYKLGKQVNLGMSYGLSSYGLARDAGISEDRAKAVLAAYFVRFRGVQTYMNQRRNFGMYNEYVETATGRKAWLNLYSKQWPNVAVNAPIQGTAAGHTKLALSILHKECKINNLLFPVVLIVHDEIVVDVPYGQMKQYRKLVKDAWIEAGKRIVPTVPMVVNIKTGLNWRVE